MLYYLKRVNNYDHIINPTKLVHRQTLSTYIGWLPIQTACVIYRKLITCVSLSNDGKFVAFGEVSFVIMSGFGSLLLVWPHPFSASMGYIFVSAHSYN